MAFTLDTFLSISLLRSPYDRMFEHLKFDVPQTAKSAFTRNPSRPSYVDSPLEFNLSDADTYIETMTNSPKRQRRLRHYFGMVKLIDDNVGKVLSAIQRLNLDKNTIVIFCSDHGKHHSYLLSNDAHAR